jgi:putative glycosyltransferase (TIGR04348 family)
MRICLVTPAPPRSYHGNRITALRWATILRELGHSVEVTQTYDGHQIDLLVALHARRSADAVRRVRATHPDVPVVLALTGTDLYPDLNSTGVDPAILAAADRLVVLQSRAVDQLPAELQDRARVIYQSAEAPVDASPPDDGAFDVALLAHVREVKDPLLVCDAARLLPDESRIQIHHAGAVIDLALGERVDEQTRTNSRYTWLGEVPPPEALRLLARSRVLVHPSRHEGGANVVSEALAAGVPVIATRIPGTEGILGRDYPGYFPVGDARSLADLLRKLELNTDGVYDDLRRRCAKLRDLSSPAREYEAWSQLLTEMSTTDGT